MMYVMPKLMEGMDKEQLAVCKEIMSAYLFTHTEAVLVAQRSVNTHKNTQKCMSDGEHSIPCFVSFSLVLLDYGFLGFILSI